VSRRGRWAAATLVAVGVLAASLFTALWAMPRIVDYFGGTINPAYVALDVATMLATGFVAAWWALARGTRSPWPPLALFVLAWPWYWQMWAYPHPAAFVTWFALNTLLVTVYMHFALAFPDGRLSTIERRFLWVAYVVPLLAQLARLLAGTYESFVPCRGSLCDWAAAPGLVDPALEEVANTVARVVWVVLILGFAALVVRRMRRSSPAAARRYRWMGWMSLARVAHQIVLQLLVLLGTELNDEVHSVLSWGFTLAIAVVFAIELRTDHWVAPQVVGVVEDVERGTPVRAALAAALEDPLLTLGYRAPNGPGYVDEEGRAVLDGLRGRVTTYLPHAADPEAILVHDAAVPAAAIHAVGPAVLLARRNHLLEGRLREQLDEVRASRARMLEASDVERRRIERDLHDGAQQHLLGLGLGLRVLRDGADGRLAQELDDLLLDLDDALSELRNLARGIHPSLLNDVGLAGAVPALVRSMPVPVVVHRLPESRLPASVETTAYYVIAEATANVVKHARAERVGVTVVADDHGSLLVEVTDDGCGGAGDGIGTGLRGLRDRVEAVGGNLVVDSPEGRGTSIRAEIPCA
jgi:signal transduction histidine kinase